MAERGKLMASIGVMLVLAAVAYIAARAFAPKPPSPEVDTTPTTIAQRGAFSAMVLGRHMVGPIMVAAGNRHTEERAVGSGGKKGGGKGGGGGSIPHYFEQGVHVLSVGPIHQLWGIYSDEGNILSGDKDSAGALVTPITSAGSPNGTTFNFGESTGRIYWGEVTQPLDAVSADLTGVNSSWPNMCYIVYDKIHNGPQPNWPNLKYEIESFPPAMFFVNTDSYYTTPKGNTGWNPAHAMYYLLTATHPHGVGMSPRHLDLKRFEETAQICERDHLVVNIAARDGASAMKTIGDIMQMAGIAMPHVGMRLCPWPVRDNYELLDGGGSPFNIECFPVFDEGDITGTLPEIENDTPAGQRIHAVVFQYPNQEYRYHTGDIEVTNDAGTSMAGSKKIENIAMPNVTSHEVANIVANRRQQELFAGRVILKATMHLVARLLSPGQRFAITGHGFYRCLSNDRMPDTGVCRIKFTPDTSAGVAGDHESTQGENGGVGNPVLPSNDIFDWVEVPYDILKEEPITPILTVLRVRAEDTVTGAYAHFSIDNFSYENAGNAGNTINRGTLNAVLDSGGRMIRNDVVITLTSIDAQKIPDVSGSQYNWLTGRFLVFINGEILFCESVTALGVDQYQLNNLVRGRYDTLIKSHSTGETVWLGFFTDFEQFTNNDVLNGQTVFLKTQPANTAFLADLTLVSPVSHIINARATLPFKADNLRVLSITGNAGRWNAMENGSDVEVRWTRRQKLNPLTAGRVLYPNVHNTAAPLVGTFTLRFYTAGDVLKRTESGLVVESYDYTSANIITDFGAFPSSMKITVNHVDLLGRESFTETITINEV